MGAIESVVAPIWIIMPVLAGEAITLAAISDCLAQSVPTRLLIINQGVEDSFRGYLERIAEAEPDRVLVWSHQPPLPSLAATWNRALDFVWRSSTGAVEAWCALVVNNDVRLHPDTVQYLNRVRQRERALFVSAVGVTREQFNPEQHYTDYDFWDAHSEDSSRAGYLLHKGGPDFSCFLIGWECHNSFRFDEGFIPAFCEDLDYHRRLMLAEEGQRIFSVNLPYLHLASQTLKTLRAAGSPEAGRIERAIEQHSRRYYQEKWGGPVNQETFLLPFSGKPLQHVTTPELQARGEGEPVKSWALTVEERRLLGQLLGQQGDDRLPDREPPSSGPGPFTDAYDEQQYTFHAEAAGAPTFERSEADGQTAGGSQTRPHPDRETDEPF